MNINPELVKVAAKMVDPSKDWDAERCGLEVMAFYLQPFGEERELEEVYFDPINTGEDAWSLELVLKKQGWDFGFSKSNKFRAIHESLRTQYDESDTLLLLRCVSAQTNIPMSTGGG